MNGKEQVLAFIQHVAEVAEAFGFQAGVGASETAGVIMSYLAEHPDELGAFMDGGFLALGRGDHRIQYHVAGRLSWHGMDGKIWFPDEVRKSIALSQAV